MLRQKMTRSTGWICGSGRKAKAASQHGRHVWIKNPAQLVSASMNVYTLTLKIFGKVPDCVEEVLALSDQDAIAAAEKAIQGELRHGEWCEAVLRDGARREIWRRFRRSLQR